VKFRMRGKTGLASNKKANYKPTFSPRPSKVEAHVLNRIRELSAAIGEWYEEDGWILLFVILFIFGLLIGYALGRGSVIDNYSECMDLMRKATHDFSQCAIKLFKCRMCCG